jgi:hypothetical protein
VTLIQKIETAIMLTLVSSCGAVACAGAQSPPTESQLVCYAQADQSASARVDSECGGHLTGCASAKAIVLQLESALAVCK